MIRERDAITKTTKRATLSFASKLFDARLRGTYYSKGKDYDSRPVETNLKLG